MNIAYTHHRLPNGLDVLIHEDHGCPIVAVNVWYHVGSKNEKPGRTGFAHLFEHLMFEGSEHYDRGFFHRSSRRRSAERLASTGRTTGDVVPTMRWSSRLDGVRSHGILLPALTDPVRNHAKWC